MTNLLSFVSWLIRRLPVLGYAIHLAETERLDRLAVLGLNVLMAIVLGLLVFGYPALVVTLWLAVGTIAALILLATAQ